MHITLSEENKKKVLAIAGTIDASANTTVNKIISSHSEDELLDKILALIKEENKKRLEAKNK
jgi:phosphopentomutase